MEYSNADVNPRKSVRIQKTPVHHVQQKTEDDSHEKYNAPRSRGCWINSTNSHSIHECKDYANSNVDDRWDMELNFRGVVLKEVIGKLIATTPRNVEWMDASQIIIGHYTEQKVTNEYRMLVPVNED